MGPVLGLIFRENRSTRELMSLHCMMAIKQQHTCAILNVQNDTELGRVVETEELTTRNDQFYETGQDFSDPFEGDVSKEDLRKENNLNDPLSSGAWTPTFVYEGTKQGSTPGQSEGVR